MTENKKGQAWREGYQTGIKEERERIQNWILRLQDYAENVRNTEKDTLTNKVAIVSLLGYLESAEYLIKNQ